MKTATNIGLREFDGNQSSNSVKRLMGIRKLDLSTEISGENIVANIRKHLITVLIWSEITDRQLLPSYLIGGQNLQSYPVLL